MQHSICPLKMHIIVLYFFLLVGIIFNMFCYNNVYCVVDAKHVVALVIYIHRYKTGLWISCY